MKEVVTLVKGYIDDIALIDKGLVDQTPICLTNLDVMFNGMKVQLK